MIRTEISSLGGQAVFRKYGSAYMSKIGRAGAVAFWKKYTVQPVQLTRFAIVNRETGEIVRIMNEMNNIRYIRATQRRRFLWRLAVSLACVAVFVGIWLAAWPAAPEAWGAVPFAALMFALAYGVQGFAEAWR